MTALILKYVHVASAALSISGYLLRGVWMMRESPQLQKKWVHIPHVIDTVLLGSAIPRARYCVRAVACGC